MPASRDQLLRLLERQSEELGKLEDAQVRRLLSIYEEAGRDLSLLLANMEATGLDDATPFTYQRYKTTLAQVDAAIAQMTRRLDDAFRDGLRALGEKEVSDLLAVLAAADADFRGVAVSVEAGALASLDEVSGLLLHRNSLERYTRETVDEIQRALLLGRTQKQSLRDIRKRLFGLGGRNDYESEWLKREHRLELIARMENKRASDEVHRGSLQAAADVLDLDDDPDPLMARADEYRDHRNHPLSPALHGRLRRLDEDWVVPQADVLRWEQVTQYRGPPSSITWPLVDGAFVGRTYPAHFGDRGRSTPWRRSWGDAGELPPPEPERAGRAPASDAEVDVRELGMKLPKQQAQEFRNVQALFKRSSDPVHGNKQELEGAYYPAMARALKTPDGPEVLSILSSAELAEVDGDQLARLLPRLKQGQPSDVSGLLAELRAFRREIATFGHKRVAWQHPVGFHVPEELLADIDIDVARLSPDGRVLQVAFQNKRHQSLNAAANRLGKMQWQAEAFYDWGQAKRVQFELHVAGGSGAGLPPKILRNAAHLAAGGDLFEIVLVFDDGVVLRYDRKAAAFVRSTP